jgi:hypothetical protein
VAWFVLHHCLVWVACPFGWKPVVNKMEHGHTLSEYIVCINECDISDPYLCNWAWTAQYLQID